MERKRQKRARRGLRPAGNSSSTDEIRPLTDAFTLFCHDVSTKTKGVTPKALADTWNTMPESGKREYFAKFEREKSRRKQKILAAEALVSVLTDVLPVTQCSYCVLARC